MCSRYYVRKFIKEDVSSIVDEAHELEDQIGNNDIFQDSDILPTNIAPIICYHEDKLIIKNIKWGYLNPQNNSLIINARAETVDTKPLFKNSYESRRCVIPAAGFYEWDSKKEKADFTNIEDTALFMCGSYDIFDNEERFVIYTTAANESMTPVHDRMPVFISGSEIIAWLTDRKYSDMVLKRTPQKLKVYKEYEQVNLFDIL